MRAIIKILQVEEHRLKKIANQKINDTEIKKIFLYL